MNFVSTLVPGFEDLYAVAEIGNPPRTVLPQHGVTERQTAVPPVSVYGYHRFV